MLQHCSGITTVVQFSFTAAIVSIQRYHRCAADRGSGCIADRNAAVGDVDSEMKSCHDPEGLFRNGLGSIRKRPIKARLGLPNPFLKRPPGQLWHLRGRLWGWPSGAVTYHKNFINDNY